jgi:hypothetical protein
VESNKTYLTPKEIRVSLGISPSNLKKNRLSGNLTDIKWSPGHRKPYYELGEVKALFHKT